MRERYLKYLAGWLKGGTPSFQAHVLALEASVEARDLSAEWALEGVIR